MHRIVTAVLAAMLLSSAALPVQAQSFGIFFGDERSDFFDDERSDVPERIMCLTDRQIRNAVADLGYANIALNVANEKHIQVRASKGGNFYLLDFNFCTGQIEGRTRLRGAG